MHHCMVTIAVDSRLTSQQLFLRHNDVVVGLRRFGMCCLKSFLKSIITNEIIETTVC